MKAITDNVFAIMAFLNVFDDRRIEKVYKWAPYWYIPFKEYPFWTVIALVFAFLYFNELLNIRDLYDGCKRVYSYSRYLKRRMHYGSPLLEFEAIESRSVCSLARSIISNKKGIFSPVYRFSYYDENAPLRERYQNTRIFNALTPAFEEVVTFSHPLYNLSGLLYFTQKEMRASLGRGGEGGRGGGGEGDTVNENVTIVKFEIWCNTQFSTDDIILELAQSYYSKGNIRPLYFLRGANNHVDDDGAPFHTFDANVSSLQRYRYLFSTYYRTYVNEGKTTIWSLLRSCRNLHKRDITQKYSHGMLLYGPPGTGKSDFIRRETAWNGCHALPLRIKSSTTETQIRRWLADSEYPPHLCEYYIEELDKVVQMLHQRESQWKQKSKGTVETNLLPNKSANHENGVDDNDTENDDNINGQFFHYNGCGGGGGGGDIPLTLGNLLDILLGVRPYVGARFRATTNNLEYIQNVCPALLQPGRLVPVYFGYARREDLVQMCEKEYGRSEGISTLFKDRENANLGISHATLHELIYQSDRYATFLHNVWNCLDMDAHNNKINEAIAAGQNNQNRKWQIHECILTPTQKESYLPYDRVLVPHFDDAGVVKQEEETGKQKEEDQEEEEKGRQENNVFSTATGSCAGVCVSCDSREEGESTKIIVSKLDEDDKVFDPENQQLFTFTSDQIKLASTGNYHLDEQEESYDDNDATTESGMKHFVHSVDSSSDKDTGSGSEGDDSNSMSSSD
jgi:hypothetical protein